MKTYIQLLSTVYFFHYIFSHEKQIAIKEGDGDRLFDKIQDGTSFVYKVGGC